MNTFQWSNHIKSFNKSFSMDDAMHVQWNERTEENMPRFNKKNSIWELDFKYYGDDEKAMVLVGSSPCLKKDVEKLKELNDNFIIICANSSARFLLENGVRPDYVVCVDSDDIDIPQHLDIDEDIPLLASTVVCKQALDNWKGPIYFMPYFSVEKRLRRKLQRRLGKMVPSGGNCITSAFFVASIIFGSKTLIFVANEYCFDSVKGYYADSKAAKQEKLKTIFPVTDVLGRERWTLPAHHNYAIWTEKMCGDLVQGYFIDTSFGLLGKDCKNIHTMDLLDAISRVNWSFDMKKKLNESTKKEKLSIIKELRGEDEQSEVFRYNMHEHRERILQLARG